MKLINILRIGVAAGAVIALSQPATAQNVPNTQKLEQQIQQLQQLFQESQKELQALREQVKANTEATKQAQAAATATAAKADATAAKADATAAKVTAVASSVVTASNPPPNTTLLNSKSLTPANVVLEPLQPTMKLINDPNTWVGLYGSIEALVQTTTNAAGGTPLAPSAKQGTRVGQIGSSWMTPDRIGFTGAHLLDEASGLNVIFRIEGEYQTPTGNQDTTGVLFNRDAWVGLEGKDFGKLTIGRQNTLGRDAIQFWGSPYGSDFANLGEGGWINQERTQAVKEYVGGVTGSRADASIVYKRLWGNWYAAAMYQFGAEQGLNNSDNAGPGGASNPGKFSNGSSEAAALAYNFGDVRVGALYNHSNVNSYSNQVGGLGGSWSVTPEVRLNGGYLIYTAEQSFGGRRVDNIVTLGANFAPTDSHFDYILAYNGIYAHHALRDANGNTLSPYSDTSKAIFDPGNTGLQTVGLAASGGQRHTGYGSLRYKFDPATLLFLGFTYTRTASGFYYDQLNGTKDSADIGIGGVYNF